MLLRRVQRGESLGLPHSRPMGSIGKRCHELRLVDDGVTWRIVYHVADDSIVILDVFSKKAAATPKRMIDESKRRLARYYAALEKE
jgi:phage-related protein